MLEGAEVRLAVDIGGTFTDIVLDVGEVRRTRKVLTPGFGMRIRISARQGPLEPVPFDFCDDVAPLYTDPECPPDSAPVHGVRGASDRGRRRMRRGFRAPCVRYPEWRNSGVRDLRLVSGERTPSFFT